MESGYNRYLEKKEMQKASKMPFYQSTWFVILMMFCCCFPVGLFLMWRYKKFNQPVRIVLTSFFALMLIFSLFTGGSSTDDVSETGSQQIESSAQEESIEETESTVETTTAALSNQEIFIQALTANPDVSEDAALSAYDILTNSLGFSEISDIDNVSGTLFEANADGYHLRITVSDKLYMVICGSYNMYENDTVQYTKQDLDDRAIGENDSAYYVIAQEIVSSNLKNPSSASFCSLSECRMGRNKDYVVVQGYVDATNSFGAQIRSEFIVEFIVIDLSSYSYEPVYINIDGQTSGEYVDIN